MIGIDISAARRFLKHPIDDARMKMHLLVQANTQYFAASGLACIAKEPELLTVRALC